MDQEQLFRRLGAFLKAWFAISLDRQDAGFAISELQDAWVDTLANFAALILEQYVANGRVEIQSIEALDQSLEQEVIDIFKAQTNIPLIAYADFILVRKLVLAIEMLSPGDRNIFIAILKNGKDVPLGRIAEILRCDPQNITIAWGRIVDTLSGDTDLQNWLFGGT